MRTSDIALLVFILVAVLFRSRGSWKKALLRVMIGVMIADVTGAILLVIFYHNYPSIIGRLGLLMPIGGLIGGLYDLLNPSLKVAPDASRTTKLDK